jgi:hypothetical protein
MKNSDDTPIPPHAAEVVESRHGNGTKKSASYFLGEEKVGYREWFEDGRLGVESGGPFSPLDPQKVSGAGRPIGWWGRWCLRADPWPILLLALLLAFGYFWVNRSPTVAMVALAYSRDLCLGSALFGLLAAGRSLQLLVRHSCESRYGIQPGGFGSRRRFWPWLAAIAGGTLLMVQLQLPMHIAFLMSRAAMDNLADEAMANPANAHLLAGRWVGMYRVAGVEVIGKTVVIYLGKDGGSYGFARVPGVASDLIYNLPDSENGPHIHRDFPETSPPRDPEGRRISGSWFVMYSGYWRVKVGWS